MFGIIADLIASVTTILLPAYLSYKALRTGDPAQTTPWLIYFIILSLTLLFESWTVFIIGWMPFYSWIRLAFLSYLVLPQTQGAKYLYLEYVEPFIVQHEKAIDLFIGDTHEKLESMGLGYMNMIVDWLRDKVLGQTAPAPAPPSAVGVGGYAQSLLSRFAMPTARPDAFGAASGVYGMLSGVATSGASAFASRSRGVPADGMPSVNEPLIPDHLKGSSNEEKSYFIASQRERLAGLMKALDKEQQSLDLAYGASSRAHSRPSSSGSGLSSGHDLKTKSRSEQSFERVEYDDLNSSQHMSAGKAHANVGSRRTASGNWVPPSVTGWFGAGGGTPGSTPGEERGPGGSRGWSAAMEVTEAVQGMSSGVDMGR